jgi:hypothetical protein
VLLDDLTFAHRSWSDRIANQEARSLVEADERVGRIIRQCVERKDLLEPC